MLQPLLIEIGLEELPAIPLLKELPNIEKKWVAVLEKYALLGDFELLYTPRRLVLWHREFKTAQEDRLEELYGAPVDIAIKEGVPTPAALGFAKKCGVPFEALSRAHKGGKEVLYYQRTIAGQSSATLLPVMIQEWLKSLNFGKSMRWASLSESFIRPIRWALVMLADQHIPMHLFGIDASTTTRVHRIASFEDRPITTIHHYFDLLASGNVILDPKEREARILDHIHALEETHDITVQIDPDLLAEVVAITEYPTPLLGHFDPHFLDLPPEVILTSMKEHQRYFGVYRADALSNAFVVVSNALCSDFSHVITGNERVLRARLSDALFFYRNDQAKGLVGEGLEKVIFMQGLGTLAEKITRERALARILTPMLALDALQEDLDRALELAKTDLMSEMVYEFTELQGLMGYYYYRTLDTSPHQRISYAIKEQYAFRAEEITNELSALMNIIIKLDTLVGMFSINELPTGSRDPFALRRAVNGILSIAIHHHLNLNLSEVFARISHLYPTHNAHLIASLESFVMERLIGYYPHINPSIIRAVVDKKESINLNLLTMHATLLATHEIATSEGFTQKFSTFKRLANIITPEDQGAIDEALLTPIERELYDALIACCSARVEESLDELFGLKEHIDRFFEGVMVNDPDPALQRNRKALLYRIYERIYAIADIKLITL